MTELMKQALIKETERHIAQDILYDDVYVGPFTEKDGVDCAVHAVDWYRNNVWHDINEKPEERKELLVYKKRDCDDSFYIALYSSDNDTVFINGRWYKLSTMTRWAYLEDLLPDNITNI